MIRLDPSLFIRRLIVHAQQVIVFDEKFHDGLNILRGENSSGKSTILNFIFFGLGGELSTWSPAALRCSNVTLEVEINGRFATIAREVSEAPMRPMHIFGGTYEDSLLAPRGRWARYPYTKQGDRETFSLFLFKALGFPPVENEISGRITMHQVLRLLYSDQITAVDDIFRFERFDAALIREAVSRLLLGSFDPKQYENEIAARTLEKEVEGIIGELRAFFHALGQVGEGMTLSWISAERFRLQETRRALEKDVRDDEKLLFSANEEDLAAKSAYEAAYQEVQNIQEEQLTERTAHDALVTV